MFALTILTDGSLERGELVTSDADPARLSPRFGDAEIDRTCFSPRGGPAGILVQWDKEPRSLVRVSCESGGFSFWPSDVTSQCPVIVEDLGLAVTTADDERDHAAVLRDSRARAGQSVLHQLELDPETTYESAAAGRIPMSSPTWLGLGRDFRTFGIGMRGVGAGNAAERLWDWIAPQWHGEPVTLGRRGPSGALSLHARTGNLTRRLSDAATVRGSPADTARPSGRRRRSLRDDRGGRAGDERSHRRHDPGNALSAG